MVKPNIKYRVTLTGAEREQLKKLIRAGRTAGYRIRHAQILLALDERAENVEWTDLKIAQAYGSNQKSIGDLRKRFVEEGLEAAVERKKRLVPPTIKIDGEAEAKIIALTCSEAPEGRSRWTLQLIANKVVEMGILESISAMAIGNLLKKTKLSHGYSANGVFPVRQRNS